MKLNRLAAFTVGVIITAVSVSAVSYVNARSDKPIKACANRKTGDMRYISKGRCKRTERTLTWNQIGLTGATGIQGLTGAAGPAGVQGVAGTTGTNGEIFHAIDATGKNLGTITQGTSYTVTIFSQGGLWSWSTEFYGGGENLFLFSDSLCTIPVVTGNSFSQTGPFEFSLSRRWILAKSPQQLPTAAYKATGQKFRIDSLTTVYEWSNQNQTCVSQSGSYYGDYWATNLVEVSLPTYTAPISIVAT